MPIDDKMTVNERRKYLNKMAIRYGPAGRGERGGLLTEMAAVTKLHRKSLVRLLGDAQPGTGAPTATLPAQDLRG